MFHFARAIVTFREKILNLVLTNTCKGCNVFGVHKRNTSKQALYCYGATKLKGGENLKHSVLRGIIFSKFQSVASFAEALGWSKGRAYRIVTGSREPTSTDIKQMASALGLSDAEDIVNVFCLR